ncbi:MAG: hypothetical protein ACRECZ_04535, partial [Methylocella sp.]
AGRRAGPGRAVRHARRLIVRPAPMLGKCADVLTGSLTKEPKVPRRERRPPSACSKRCAAPVTIARGTA